MAEIDDTQAVAAGDTGACVHRIAQVAKAGDVLADRPRRDHESRGELVAAPVTSGLEQTEEAQQPG